MGIDGQWSLLVSVVVAVALNIGNYYLGSEGAYQAAIQGLLIGLAASGLYDVAKVAGPVKPPQE